MAISKLHYISQGATKKEHLENIQQACQCGAELVQLRLKNTSDKQFLKAAEEAREITSHYQTRLIINDDYKVGKAVKADGVHLELKNINPKNVRKELYSWQIIGGTANTLQDCEQRVKENVDYIGLGPFRFTSTKEKLDPVLGKEGYLTILEELQTQTPIIAVGGISLKDVIELMKTGVYGIAISGEITKDFNQIPRFHQLLKTGSTEAQKYTF